MTIEQFCFLALAFTAVFPLESKAAQDVSVEVISDIADINYKHKSIIWTKARNPPHMKSKLKKAFRDFTLENVAHRLIHKVIKNLIGDATKTKESDPPAIYLKDNIQLNNNLSLVKFDCNIKNMRVLGLNNLRISYLRVIRHYGLRDIKMLIRLETDVQIEGKYFINGMALNFVPISGNDNFIIDINGFRVSAISFVAIPSTKDQEDLMVKEVETTVEYDNVAMNFFNLMGGGLVGSAANMAINSLGNSIINEQKKKLLQQIKRTFKRELSKYL